MTPELVNGLFALLGAAIGAIATFLSTKGHVEEKSLRVRFGDIHEVLEPLKKSHINVDLQISGTSVHSLQKQTVWISNTGNRSIEDLSIPFRLFFSSSLFECFSNRSNNKNIPQVKVIKVSLSSSIMVEVDFLNQGETFSVDFLYDDLMDNRLICDFRRPGIFIKQSYGEEQKQLLLELSRVLLPSFLSRLISLGVAILSKR